MDQRLNSIRMSITGKLQATSSPYRSAQQTLLSTPTPAPPPCQISRLRWSSATPTGTRRTGGPVWASPPSPCSARPGQARGAAPRAAPRTVSAPRTGDRWSTRSYWTSFTHSTWSTWSTMVIIETLSGKSNFNKYLWQSIKSAFVFQLNCVYLYVFISCFCKKKWLYKTFTHDIDMN